jgi:hypothetical protein
MGGLQIGPFWRELFWNGFGELFCKRPPEKFEYLYSVGGRAKYSPPEAGSVGALGVARRSKPALRARVPPRCG